LGPKVTDSSKLAMKGIIGIGAMAQMSRAFGNSQDSGFYSVGFLCSSFIFRPLKLHSFTGQCLDYGSAMEISRSRLQ